jgi:RNA polymerase sigma factor (sigma-70 family)
MARRLTHLLPRLLRTTSDPPPDADLLWRFAADRDESAFAALVDRHGPMVLAVCRRATGDEHRAEDVFQSVFLVLARKAGRLSRPDRLAGWLHGVARRLGGKVARREAAVRERDAHAVPVPAPDLRAAGADLLRALDEELARLPERERVPLILCYLEGRTQDEAARTCGLSVRTLRRRLAAGRERLRERLEQRGATLASVLVAAAVGPAVGSPLQQRTLAAVSGWASRGVSAGLAAGGATVRTLTKVAVGVAVVVGVAVGAAWVWNRGPAGPARTDAGPPPPTAGLVRPMVRFPHDPETDWLRSSGTIRFEAGGQRLVTVGSELREWSGVPLRSGEAFAPKLPAGWPIGHSPFFLAPDGKTVVGFRGHGHTVSGIGPKPVSLGVWERGRADPRVVVENLLIDWMDAPQHAFSPDSRRLVVVGHDTTAVLDLTSGAVLARLKGDESRAPNVTAWFAPDGRSVSLLDYADRQPRDDGVRDYTLKRWDYLNPKALPVPVATIAEVPSGLSAVSPDGNWFAAVRQGSESFSFQLVGSWGNSKGRTKPTREVHVWELATGKKVGSFDAGAGVWQVWFENDGTAWVLTRDAQRGPFAVSRWEVPSGKRLLDSPARVPDDAVYAVSPDGRTFAAIDRRSVRRWDLTTGRAIDPEPDPRLGWWSRYSADGKEVLQWDREALRRWDAQTGRRLPDRQVVEWPHLAGAYPDPNGLTIMADFVPESGRHVLSVWDAEKTEKVADLGPQPDQYPNGYVHSAAVSPDRKWVVVCGAADATSAYLRRWDLGTKRMAWDVRVKGVNTDLTVSPDGKSVYLGSYLMCGFDADTGRERFRRDAVELPADWLKGRYRGQRSWVGDKMAMLVRDRGVAVFDPDTGTPTRLLDVPNTEVYGVSADCRRLAVLGRGEKPAVRVFDTATWEQVWAGASDPRAEPVAVRFSPDGRRLLALYGSGPVSGEVFSLAE